MECSRNFVLRISFYSLVIAVLWVQVDGQFDVKRESFDVINQPLNGLNKSCESVNAMDYFEDGKCSCRTKSDGFFYSIGMYNEENDTMWCYSVKTIGCGNITIEVFPVINSHQTYSLTYLFTVPHIKNKFVGFDTFTYNINSTENRTTWEPIQHSVASVFFDLNGNRLSVKDLGNIWDGHAIRFNLKFHGEDDQCLFVKVAGRITYPKKLQFTPPITIVPAASFPSHSPSMVVSTFQPSVKFPSQQMTPPLSTISKSAKSPTETRTPSTTSKLSPSYPSSTVRHSTAPSTTLQPTKKPDMKPVIMAVTLPIFFVLVLVVATCLIIRNRMLKKRKVLPNHMKLCEVDNASTSSASLAKDTSSEQKYDKKHFTQEKFGSKTTLHIT